MFSASKSGSYRAIVWLLVVSSLACWEIAATRIQGCFPGDPELRACQAIDLYAPDYMVAAKKHNYYKSAQLLALTSHSLVINPLKSVYAAADPITKWQSHYDVPPTPPPDSAISTFFA